MSYPNIYYSGSKREEREEREKRERGGGGAHSLQAPMSTDIAMQFSALNVNIFQYQDEVMVEKFANISMCLVFVYAFWNHDRALCKRRNTP